MEKKKNKPELRFPEFTDNWEITKLGSFFNERNESSTQEYPLYSLTIENGIIPKSERYERSFLVNDISEAYKVMLPDDFAFNPMNLRFGALARHKGSEKVSISKYYNIFYCNEKGYSAFFEYYLTSYDLIQYYNKMATGSLVEKKRVHYLDFIHFKKYLPTLAEQTRIASFFTSIDQKLTQLKQKKNLLEEYKKGLMQKLFSQELRFKIKNEHGKLIEPPKWEKKKLGEVIEIQGGYAFKSNLFNQGVTKVIRIGDILPNIYLDKFTGAISAEIPDKKYKVKKNDFVMALSGATFGKVGKIMDDGPAFINQRVALFKTNDFLEYFYQLVQTDDFKNYINSIPTASAQPNISNSDILNFKTLIPSLAEQTLIANFLTAIDKKIMHCEKQIEQTEIWKKGLLQKMFV